MTSFGTLLSVDTFLLTGNFAVEFFPYLQPHIKYFSCLSGVCQYLYVLRKETSCDLIHNRLTHEFERLHATCLLPSKDHERFHCSPDILTSCQIQRRGEGTNCFLGNRNNLLLGQKLWLISSVVPRAFPSSAGSEDKIPFDFHSKYELTYVLGEQKYVDEILIAILFIFLLYFLHL